MTSLYLKVANFEEIRPGKDLTKFLLVNLLNPYSVSMVEPKWNQAACNAGKSNKPGVLKYTIRR